MNRDIFVQWTCPRINKKRGSLKMYIWFFFSNFFTLHLYIRNVKECIKRFCAIIYRYLSLFAQANKVLIILKNDTTDAIEVDCAKYYANPTMGMEYLMIFIIKQNIIISNSHTSFACKYFFVIKKREPLEYEICT